MVQFSLQFLLRLFPRNIYSSKMEQLLTFPSIFCTDFPNSSDTCETGLSKTLPPPTNSTFTKFPTIIDLIPENFRRMSYSSKIVVIVYSILFILGVPSNLSIFISVGRQLLKPQLMRSRIKFLIWNLATADLIVCCVVIPIEVVWRLTVQWYGGDLLCKVAQFFRAFGLYLSSMVIICISLDRFLVILFPLRVIAGMNKRVIRMLWVSWACAILFATPQVSLL
jgi:gonadotropin-releasing hormone receptor